MAAASSSGVLFSGLTDLPNIHYKPPPYPSSHHLFIRPLLSYKPRAPASISCLISGVDGGGVSDDFVSTHKSDSFYHELSVIANTLKNIEPLDTSVISKGVSDSAKDSMKQMISTMLGLLPSDEFSVMIRAFKRPFVRMLVSSIITGYTLWNAEYRIMLMRNIETSPVDMPKRLKSGDPIEDQIEENESVFDDSVGMVYSIEDLERLNLQSCLADLPPEAMHYIQQLESELSTAKKDLYSQKQKQQIMEIGYAIESNNDLLRYLRSLDSDMVDELSRPSSPEVKEVLQQLVHCISSRVFKEDIISGLMEDSEILKENYQNNNINYSKTRDYLAKLLFWCMLLGHQLRGLENRLYLSCAVGFL